ncbi:LacI family transcriptional regulator [Virgibacillus soli]|uniref:LacI family DNA-binding transcriptional regulator n=1 Tax=Lederbergia galactosidilytica TaxID=217031 RepID=UPI00071266D2|nr:LacI family DNA-binding transcriptional regulator [Lederbergia galactosidilytica]KRG15141.1 LacI family transcriptional regulator [Virgibacillus soli]MBP1913214.1 LacI family transcriptional regulator [Lederbergia galactosidilytica]
MKKQTTIYDIARKAKTSTATVSRVLSNSNYPVSNELKERIKEVAKELNYIPNMIGRQLKTNNSMTIGVIIPSITNPFYSSIVLGIEDIARSRGYHVLLCNSHRSSELEEEYLKTLFEKQVRGLIVSSISSNKELVEALVQKGLNVVAFDQTIEGLESSQIQFDFRKGGFLATEHLIEKGHRKIAFISSPLTRPSRLSIYEGYQQALEKYEIEVEREWIQIASREEEISERNYEFKNGIDLTKKLLQCSDLPTAIFVCNDMTAFGVMNELANQGIKVPQQMSVIGFDNIEFSQMMTPPLTTIQQPDYEMGRMACNLLLDQLDGEETKQVDIILQPKVIERQSTKVLDKVFLFK